MGRIDPMYQFSLDAYINLFVLSIDKSHRSNKLEDRIDYLNEYHTYAVYRCAPRASGAPHLPRICQDAPAPVLPGATATGLSPAPRGDRARAP